MAEPVVHRPIIDSDDTYFCPPEVNCFSKMMLHGIEPRHLREAIFKAIQGFAIKDCSGDNVVDDTGAIRITMCADTDNLQTAKVVDEWLGGESDFETGYFKSYSVESTLFPYGEVREVIDGVPVDFSSGAERGIASCDYCQSIGLPMLSGTPEARNFCKDENGLSPLKGAFGITVYETDAPRLIIFVSVASPYNEQFNLDCAMAAISIIENFFREFENTVRIETPFVIEALKA